MLRALSMAALGAHRRQLFDLAGDHLEDSRGPPAQRSAFLQFNAAPHWLAATASGQAAAAGRAEARLLSQRHHDDQTAPRIAGDAPRAAQDRAGQAGELLSETDVATNAGLRSPDAAQHTRVRAWRGPGAGSVMRC